MGDMGDVCFGQVASATFGDGDGITMHYFMSAEGFQKLTSLCPCPVWFVKAVADARKALFVSSELEETVECSDAYLVCLLLPQCLFDDPCFGCPDICD